MVRFKRKKTYSRFFGISVFAAISILAVIANNNDESFSASNYSAGLSGSHFTQYFLSILPNGNHNLLLWVAIIILFTLLGFLFGRFIDKKKAKYVIVDN